MNKTTQRKIISLIASSSIGFPLGLIITALTNLNMEAYQREEPVYETFQRAVNSNLSCKFNPYCRDLTKGEKNYAKRFFGNTLPYEDIKIYTPWPFERTLNKYKTNANGIYSIAEHFSDGNLHFYRTPPENDNDFLITPESPPPFTEEAKYVLIHELTHSWQRATLGQEKLTKKWIEDNEALKDELKENYNSIYAYTYEFPFTKPFKAYGIEQQATIIQNLAKLKDIFSLKNTFGDVFHICEKYKAYIALASQELPIETTEKEKTICTQYQLTPNS